MQTGCFTAFTPASCFIHSSVFFPRLRACFACLFFFWWKMLLNVTILLCPGTIFIFIAVHNCSVLDVWNRLFFCPAGSHSAKQPGFITQKKKRKKKDNYTSFDLLLHPPSCQLNQLTSSSSVPSHAFIPLWPFPCCHFALLVLSLAKPVLNMLGWHAPVSLLLHF